jgi:hypothetical protein
MGRPLKIAKSQAVLTITGTSASTQLVTVSNNLNTLGIIKGMPFVTASTVGGLTGGVTYYVNKVVSASTFSVSATQLSVQPQTFPTLTNTSAQTVKATVGEVDTGFNNPDGSNTSTGSSTFGVVGGNTAQYGKQTLCNVAFGANISGTIFASNASATVVGLGTDFANVANGTQLFAYQGTPGNYSLNLLGTVANNVGNVTVAVANSSATGNVIGTSGNAQTLVAGTPVVFDTAFGNLLANTTYFVRNIPNAAAFTVAAVPGGANVVLTSNSSVTSNAIQNQAVLGANSVVNAAGYNGYGDPILAALPEAGYIVRQKGKHKYLVAGTVTGITAPAYLANVANASLLPNTFNVQVTYADSSTAYLDTISDYNSQAFPTTVAPGSLTPGSVYTIYYSGTTNWVAVGAMGNMTGVTFTATGTGSGTGLAILANAQPNVIGTFGSAVAANTYYTPSLPIVTVNNA